MLLQTEELGLEEKSHFPSQASVSDSLPTPPPPPRICQDLVRILSFPCFSLKIALNPEGVLRSMLCERAGCCLEMWADTCPYQPFPHTLQFLIFFPYKVFWEGPM